MLDMLSVGWRESASSTWGAVIVALLITTLAMVMVSLLIARLVFSHRYYRTKRVQKALSGSHPFRLLETTTEEFYEPGTENDATTQDLVKQLSRPATKLPERSSEQVAQQVETSSPAATEPSTSAIGAPGTAASANPASASTSAALPTVADVEGGSDAPRAVPDRQGAANVEEAQSRSRSDQVARKLAVRCGRAVRYELGCPKLTEANKCIVIQRCRAWLRENASSLREAHFGPCLMRAAYVALTPSPEERQFAEAIACPAATAARCDVDATRVVPSGWIASLLPESLVLSLPWASYNNSLLK